MSDPLVMKEPGGSITIPASVLARLVVRAAETVDGAQVRRRRSIDIAHGNGRSSVSLELSVRYGEALPELAHAVQERVTGAVAATCDLEVERVDLRIEEIS